VGNVFNLGNSDEITIRELAELVKTMTASDSEIVTIPYEKAYESGFEDMPRRVPDLTKAKNLVGYEPRVQLPEILTKVIEHHRAQRMEYV
jgi:UDP-glucose 4-epimerase